MNHPIYFDHAATTPLDERVLGEMIPWLTTGYGNPSSLHQKGQAAKVALEDARESVAAQIGAEPSEVIFTSGGTESNNAAIKGTFNAAGQRKKILSSQAEHHAVIHPVNSLKGRGAKPVLLTPDSEGRISPEQVAQAIDEQTALVSLMHVNNELGTINPIAEIASICREKGVVFHSDCVQSAGKIPLSFRELGLDLMSLSGHKIYGPKGVGVMVVRRGAPWISWMQGGSQERGRRGGTANIAGIVGLQKALELAVEEMQERNAAARALRKRLLERLGERFAERFRINGPQAGEGVPHILNIGFPEARNEPVDGEMLLLNLDIEGICVSSGSACTSGAVEPSHVLTAIGLESAIANASLRISLGKANRAEEVDRFAEKLQLVLARMLAVA